MKRSAWEDKNFQVIGVAGDMIKFSPFDAIKPTIFIVDAGSANIMNIRMASGVPISTALAKMEPLFKKHNPQAPFEFKFVDEQYGYKFYKESRLAKIAGFFALLAIFISCLGLFGLASYIAEQVSGKLAFVKCLGQRP